jgi:hypothetical protein
MVLSRITLSESACNVNGNYIKKSINDINFNGPNGNYIRTEIDGYYVYDSSLGVDVFFIAFNLVDYNYLTPYCSYINIESQYTKNIIKGIESKDYINKITLTNNSAVNGDYLRGSPENYIFTCSSSNNYILSGIPSGGLWGLITDLFVYKINLVGSNPDYSCDGTYVRNQSGVNGLGVFYEKNYATNGKYISGENGGPGYIWWSTFPHGYWSSLNSFTNWEPNADTPNPVARIYYSGTISFYSSDLINWNIYSGNVPAPKAKISYGESKRFINKVLITGGQYDNNLYVRTGIGLRFEPFYEAPVMAYIWPPEPYSLAPNAWRLADEVENVYYSYDLINWQNINDEHSAYIVPSGVVSYATTSYNFNYGKLTTKKRN